MALRFAKRSNFSRTILTDRNLTARSPPRTAFKTDSQYRVALSRQNYAKRKQAREAVPPPLVSRVAEGDTRPSPETAQQRSVRSPPAKSDGTPPTKPHSRRLPPTGPRATEGPRAPGGRRRAFSYFLRASSSLLHAAAAATDGISLISDVASRERCRPKAPDRRSLQFRRLRHGCRFDATDGRSVFEYNYKHGRGNSRSYSRFV